MGTGKILAGELVITTDAPEAKIFFRKASELQENFLGNTTDGRPLKWQTEKLRAQNGDSGTILLIARQKGYLDTQVLISNLGEENIFLKMHLEMQDQLLVREQLDQWASHLFESQRLARIKDYPNALKELDQAENIFPQASTNAEMRGSIYFFQQNYPQALGQFRKAVSRNPANVDAFYFQRYLEGILGEKNGAHK